MHAGISSMTISLNKMTLPKISAFENKFKIKYTAYDVSGVKIL